MDIKHILKAGIKFFANSDYRFSILSAKGFYNNVPDEEYLKKLYKVKVGRELNLENPQTFTEKLNWLKVYDHNPRYTMLADKYQVREWVAETIGEEYLVPLLGVFDSADEINFDLLPDKFALKCTHNSGEGMCLCRDKSQLDTDNVVRRLNIALKKNYYQAGREWAYKNIVPRIICEEMLECERVDELFNTIINYKFYCFDGEPRFLYVAIDNTENGKKNGTKLNILDLNWEKTPFYRTDHAPINDEIKKPADFDKMIDISRKLAAGFPFARVDLYYVNDKIYFSEMTFCPGAGIAPFFPQEWERKIGDWITLPISSGKVD